MPQCDFYLKNDRWGKNSHSNDCRDRIQTELAGTDLGQKRIAAAKERLDNTLWELGGGRSRDLPHGENVDAHVDDVAQDRAGSRPPEFLPLPEDHAVEGNVDADVGAGNNVDTPVEMGDESPFESGMLTPDRDLCRQCEVAWTLTLLKTNPIPT